MIGCPPPRPQAPEVKSNAAAGIASSPSWRPRIARSRASVASPSVGSAAKPTTHQHKRLHDPAYAQTCQNSPENWRREHPDYNRQYRQTHPQAVERNREGERQRYRYRQLANLAKNNLAFELKRCAAEVWLLAPAGTVLAKNHLALSQVFIVQPLTPAATAPTIP